MEAKPHLEQSVQEEPIRAALNKHWHASAAGDANTEHDIYDDDALCDYPQPSERILGRKNLQALRSHHPGKPSGLRSSGFSEAEISGSPNAQSLTKDD